VDNHKLSHGGAVVGWSAIIDSKMARKHNNRPLLNQKWPENTIKDYHIVRAVAIFDWPAKYSQILYFPSQNIQRWKQSPDKFQHLSQVCRDIGRCDVRLKL